MVQLGSSSNSKFSIGCLISLWFMMINGTVAYREGGREMEESSRGGRSDRGEGNEKVIVVEEGRMRNGNHYHHNHHGNHNHHRKGKDRSPYRIVQEQVDNENSSSSISSEGGGRNDKSIVVGSFFNTLASSVDSSAVTAVISNSNPNLTISTVKSLTSVASPTPTSMSSSRQQGSESERLGEGVSIIHQGPTKTRLISITTQIVGGRGERNDNRNEEGRENNRYGEGRREEENENRGDEEREGKGEEEAIVVTELAETEQENQLSNDETETIICRLEVTRTEIVGRKAHTAEEKICHTNIGKDFFHSKGGDSSTSTSSAETSTSTSTSNSNNSGQVVESSSSSSVVLNVGDSGAGIGATQVGFSTIETPNQQVTVSLGSTQSASTSTSASDPNLTSTSTSDLSSTSTDSSLASPTSSGSSASSTDSSGNLVSITINTSGSVDNGFPTSTPSATTDNQSSSTSTDSNASSGFVTVTTSSTDPSATNTDSSISLAGDLTANSAAADQSTPTSQAAFVLPGRQLSVLPIGLGVFAGISVLALVIVGVVTYERKKYRRQFRLRTMAQQAGRTGMGGNGSQGFDEDEGMREVR